MRLIDADKIGLTDFEIIMCKGDYREAFKMLLDKINNQAIVFDVDKVIAELENLQMKATKHIVLPLILTIEQDMMHILMQSKL